MHKLYPNAEQMVSILKRKPHSTVGVENKDSVIVKFSYNGKNRVLRPYEADGHSVSGWVVNEAGEAAYGSSWAGDEDEPFKMFLIGKMENIEVIKDEEQD